MNQTNTADILLCGHGAVGFLPTCCGLLGVRVLLHICFWYLLEDGDEEDRNGGGMEAALLNICFR